MYAVYPIAESRASRFDILNVDFFNIVFVACIASLASFLNRQSGGPNGEPRKWSWLRFLAHLSASVVSAILASNLAMIMGVDSDRVLFAIAGVCGWAGKEGIDWMIYAIRMKVLMFAGLNKASDRESHRYEDDDMPQRPRTYNQYNEPGAPDMPMDTSEKTGSLRRKKNPTE